MTNAVAHESASMQSPDGWAIATVAKLFESWGGATPSTGNAEYWGPGTPWVSSKDVKAWTIDGGTESVTDAAVRESRLRVCPPGSVLVVIRSGVLVHTLPVAITSVPVVINQDLKAFTSSDLDLNRWLALALRCKAQEILTASRRDGTTVQSVRYEHLTALEIPLPPLPEQRRIVAKVEELLGRVNAARERLAKVPAILKRFRQAVLAAACDGRLTADWREGNAGDAKRATGWQSKTVAEVCTDIVDCPHSTPKWAGSGEVCLRTTNFQPGRLDLTEVRFVSPETYASRIKRLEPSPGDVLYSREGGILGIACLFPAQLRACLGQRMMLMRAGRTIRPEYLMHLLNSPESVDRVRELTGGTASPHLNVGDVKAFAVLLPPIDEQREIVRRVDALFALADRIEARVAAATARVGPITQAVLAKAFRGELVPTEAELARREGREYETAAVLLERIRAERAEQPSPRPSANGRGRNAERRTRKGSAKGATRKQKPTAEALIPGPSPARGEGSGRGGSHAPGRGERSKKKKRARVAGRKAKRRATRRR